MASELIDVEISLVKACAEKNLEEARLLFAQLSPNQVVDIVKRHEDVDFAYPLWSISETWGFEVCWAHEYSLPLEEREPKLDLPDFETLTPDKPLKDHAMWGLSDQLIDGQGWTKQAVNSFYRRSAEELGLPILDIWQDS